MSGYLIEMILALLLSNFTSLFSSSNPQFPVDLDNLILPVISDEDNELLCAIPTAPKSSKLYSALAQTNPQAQMVCQPFSSSTIGRSLSTILLKLSQVFSQKVTFSPKSTTLSSPSFQNQTKLQR